ncbi:MAG: inorganic phosphate transporter [Deltaproteobacteria bacterium]|nr:inorganic phosphate transporter [Deltaproteobacteria bacterium]
MLVSLIVLIVAALVFDFLNGFHDASNIVATMISSRAVSPRKALALVTIGEVSGPFLFGVAVATTIGSGVVEKGAVTMPVLIAALCGAITWNVITWFFGIPSSSSHALVGGIIGAVVVEHGFSALMWSGISKILLALFISPPLGLLGGFIIQRAILITLKATDARPGTNWIFRNGQLFTSAWLALSHGSNDAQKTMGIITMGLLATGQISEFAVPTWVIALSAAAIGLGTATGGWRLIKTLGYGFYKVWPIHAFTTQLSSAVVILSAALLGGPVSTTQVVSSAIVGVGASERVQKVRWTVAGQIVIAWVLTIPSASLVAAGVYLLVRRFS